MKDKRTDIALVGMSAIFPGSVDKTGFWKDILNGRDLLTDIPNSHWLIEDYYDPDPSATDKTYGKRGGFLPHVDFDPMEFAILPSSLSATDTSQLLSLIVAKQVLEDAAQGQFQQMDKERISVILGVASTTELVGQMVGRLQRPIWVKSLRESGLPEDQVQEICDRISNHYVPWQESTFPGLLGNVVAGRIANRMNLGGTNCVIDAACASSLASVSMAMMELETGNSDLVITGGVDTLNDIFMYMCFSKTPALSPTGDCRPFSEQADGTMLGEGVGMVALKRLTDAERDGDRIYAVIKGMGSSSDGQSKSVYAPVAGGQAKALRRAYQLADYSPSTVELVEAHGTATKAGDLAEFEGLSTVYNESDRKDRQWCALGSVKSQIGHTKAAAGSAGLFKAVMALHHKVLPPTIKVTQPNPKLQLEQSPFYLNTQTRPWIRGSDHPRRASVSAFGFGGSNFHVTLEEYHGTGHHAWRLRTLPTELVLISGNTKLEVLANCQQMIQACQLQKAFHYQAKQSQERFRPEHPQRLAIVAENAEDLSQKLQQAVLHLSDFTGAYTESPGNFYFANGVECGSVAFLFPGQGSQYVGMSGDVAMAFDSALRVWDDTADIAFAEQEKLHDIVFPLPSLQTKNRDEQQRKLTSTEWAQPALGAASLAYLSILQQIKVVPDALAGHSFGEIVALSAAGSMDQESLLRIARKRGKLMAEAAKVPGAMTAVFCTKEQLQPLLEQSGTEVVIANHNAPQQLVISGKVDQIEQIEKQFNLHAIRSQRLQVSTAFHSPLVQPGIEPFKQFLKTLSWGHLQTKVYSNSLAAPYENNPESIRDRISEQIALPVRFVEQIEAMYQDGIRTFVEVGPGSALSGLVDKCLQDRHFHTVSVDRKGVHGITGLWHALGKLAVLGVKMDLASLWESYEPIVDPAALKKPLMTVPISGVNYGKPYPPKGGADSLPKPNVQKEPAIKPMELKSIAEEITAKIHLAPPKDDYKMTVHEEPHQLAKAKGEELLMTRNTPNSYPTELLAVFQEMQRQTSEAHIAYQQAMAQGHMSYLKAAETTLHHLLQITSGVAVPAWQQGSALDELKPVQLQPLQTLTSQQTNTHSNLLVQPDMNHVHAQEPSIQERKIVAMKEPVQHSLIETELSTVAVVAQASSEGLIRTQEIPAEKMDAEQILFEIVSEKTGYPVEMLDLNMELESGLGIDSIKRVEILSAIDLRIPNLPEIQTGIMASMNTLGEIVAYMRENHGFTSIGSDKTDSASASVAAKETSLTETDIQKLLLAIVSEKTGYPIEMLDMSMELESGLGIDSIKRVEILSAFEVNIPNLPEMPMGEMANIRTLGDIVDFFRQAPAF
jgi:polyketide-type polyunsaturated fatty acid synthase PfaA